jgi:hypothetical protein
MEDSAYFKALPQNLTAETEKRLQNLREDNQSVDKT